MLWSRSINPPLPPDLTCSQRTWLDSQAGRQSASLAPSGLHGAQSTGPWPQSGRMISLFTAATATATAEFFDAGLVCLAMGSDMKAEEETGSGYLTDSFRVLQPLDWKWGSRRSSSNHKMFILSSVYTPINTVNVLKRVKMVKVHKVQSLYIVNTGKLPADTCDSYT